MKATVFYGEAQRSMGTGENQQNPGSFMYHEDGFEYPSKDGQRKIKWADIDSLVAYKANVLTTGETCLDIVWGDWQTTITEQTPGWQQFIEKIKTVFPNIPKDWVLQIVQPPFAENRTVLYQRATI